MGARSSVPSSAATGVAKPKSTIRVGNRGGKVVTTKKGKGIVDKVLKSFGK